MVLVLGPNEIFRQEIEAAQERTSLDGSAIAALIDAEAAKIKSGQKKGQWDKESYNAGSHAAGLTQFLQSTWIGHAKSPSHLLNQRAKELGLVDQGNSVRAGKTQELLDLRFDPMLSIMSAAEYGEGNLKILAKAGVVPGGLTDDQRAQYMYLAHHEGPGGAVGFLDGSKRYSRSDLVGQVGGDAADQYIRQSNGDTSRAYRNWLNNYVAQKIVPSKYRSEAASTAVRTSEQVPTQASSEADGLMYVTTEGLNFRREPDGEIISSLTLGQPVTVLSVVGDTGWRTVSIDGVQGVVSGAYLRPPLPDPKERLLRFLVSEWVKFKKGRSSEEEEPYNTYVHEMWRFLGQDWYGNSKYPNGEDVPWSAAFISFTVANSGPEYIEFAFNASHSVFSNDAIRAKVMREPKKPYWAYRIGEAKPEIGDIVHRNRSGGVYSYEYAENHTNFMSHSDIVCEVRGRVARVIGGNTGGGEGTVAMHEYVLDSEGYLTEGQKVIALLKNRADEVQIDL